MTKSAVFILPVAVLAMLLVGASALAQVPAPDLTSQSKKIFAHYMGCFPVGSGATHHERGWNPSHTRHDGRERFRYGDKWRNWPLVPPGPALDAVASADLEIRRALRGGIDGFAVDTWAGGVASTVPESPEWTSSARPLATTNTSCTRRWSAPGPWKTSMNRP
jgi:hypothetical protein